MNDLDFDSTFKVLTGNEPFPWQQALFKKFISDDDDFIPHSCQLPTGLGKTSVMAIWLIAREVRPDRIPRRLVYVVNRRTVVDQTTTEAEHMREQAGAAGVSGPAISTLRGQFADNREWSANPSQPAIIIGTVDMIGSRLLFSGYGLGSRLRPLHAGFLGQDVLLVHDEAHLEQPFQKLLETIRSEQARCRDFATFRVMELTATPRGAGTPFQLSEEDRKHPTVRQRILAHKQIVLHAQADSKSVVNQIVELAMAHADSGNAILVFARQVDEVQQIADQLRDKKKQCVAMLTGTMRGLERDALVESNIFQRFLPEGKETPGTVFLVCTSAGEVGVNLSADHLVCDLSTFDSMAQRFGRVNRFGKRNDTRIDIVHPETFEKSDIDERRERTLALLQALNGNGSPHALDQLNSDDRKNAFAPTPRERPATDILFDRWALTTISGKFPGRPPVEPYLHGETDFDVPQTTFAWRWEVELLTDEVLTHNRLKREFFLDEYPLKPHEQLTLPTYGRGKAWDQLEKIAARDAKSGKAQLSAWVIDRTNRLTTYRLQDLIEKDRLKKPVVDLAGCTVLLPPAAGGLNGSGFLQGDCEIANDVADEWFTDKSKIQRRRWRLFANTGEQAIPPDGMRRIRQIELRGDQDEDETDDDTNSQPRTWFWYTLPKSADDNATLAFKDPVLLTQHTADVEAQIQQIAVTLLRKHPELQQALELAARFHDLGKRRVIWQRSIGSRDSNQWYAKSAKGWRPLELSTYRHEFGSLLDAQKQSEFQALNDRPELQDLILHLIAVHHGYGRPYFPEDRAFDPSVDDMTASHVAGEVALRFARLQRKFGRWGLAYLESLLRAADYAASANPGNSSKGVTT